MNREERKIIRNILLAHKLPNTLADAILRDVRHELIANKGKRCIICGEATHRNTSYCVGCEEPWTRRMIIGRSVQQGDCEVWTGLQRRNVPYVDVTQADGVRRGVHVRRKVMEKHGIFDERPVKTTCDTPLCVKFEHLALVLNGNDPAHSAGLQGRLDSAPLVRAVEMYQRVPGHAQLNHRISMIYNRAKDRGWITVIHADEICIDLLNVNPVLVFGEEFLTA